MQRSGQSLADLAKVMTRYPQVLTSVAVARKVPLDQLRGLGKLVRDIEDQLGNDGRVVMRYSGTEAKLRVMLEGPDEDRLREFAEQIVETAVAELAVA